MTQFTVNEPERASYLDVEDASFRAEEIGCHVGLLALAAEGMIADGDEIVGKKVRGFAYALEMQMDTLAAELKRLSEAWRLERIAAKSH